MKLRFLLVILSALCLFLLMPRAEAIPIDPAPEQVSLNSTDDASFLALLAGSVKFAIGVAAATVVVKSVLATAGNRTAQELGFARVTLGPLNVEFADFAIDHTNSGFSGLPFGHAEALVQETGHVRFSSDPASLGIATIIATVSQGSADHFEISSSANPAFESASASVSSAFGIGDPNNLLSFLGAPLFSFSRSVSGNAGTLSGSIPETSFSFQLSPGQSIDFVGTFSIGGHATTVPEPSALFLSFTALFVMAVIGLRIRRSRC